MSILDYGGYNNPKYDHLEHYCNRMYKSFWTPGAYKSLIEEQDAPYYHNVMGEADKEAIKRCLLSIATVENKVKAFWMNLHNDIPQTVISDVGGLFGAQEVIHRQIYEHLLNVLRIDTNNIEQYPPLANKIKYLKKYLEKDNKAKGKRGVLKRLVLFTALTERLSLFTSFYILSSWSNAKRGLDTISAVQKSTAQEELYMHYAFGLDITNIIKKEEPNLWNDYMQELVTKSIAQSYKAELEIIDWFFEKGVPKHITKDEVVNFLNYNFKELCFDFEIDLEYHVDEDLFREKNLWMMVRLSGNTNSDFFNNETGNYSNQEEIIDNTDNFKF